LAGQLRLARQTIPLRAGKQELTLDRTE